MKDRLVTIVLSVAASYGLMKSRPESAKELEVDRLIVRKELIASDTRVAWEKGYEAHQIGAGWLLSSCDLLTRSYPTCRPIQPPVGWVFPLAE